MDTETIKDFLRENLTITISDHYEYQGKYITVTLSIGGEPISQDSILIDSDT